MSRDTVPPQFNPIGGLLDAGKLCRRGAMRRDSIRIGRPRPRG